MSERFLPVGAAAHDPYDLFITPETLPWRYAGLRIVTLPPGGNLEWATEGEETAVLPLRGGCTVTADGEVFDLAGRTGVFDAVSDFAYLPRDAEAAITSPTGGEFALCTAPARRRIAPYAVAAGDIDVEVRGGGPGTRQINNFLSADAHDADRLIAVEVITPEGGWSSYPPHKHDEFSEEEVELEEIYYFKIAGRNGVGVFACYTPDRSIDDTVTVRDGDTYLVPRGYHGPSGATPGHHMYFLNVMAGPAEERIWRFTDDPAHAGARAALEQLPPDPRLPLTQAG